MNAHLSPSGCGANTRAECVAAAHLYFILGKGTHSHRQRRRARPWRRLAPLGSGRGVLRARHHRAIVFECLLRGGHGVRAFVHRTNDHSVHLDRALAAVLHREHGVVQLTEEAAARFLVARRDRRRRQLFPRPRSGRGALLQARRHGFRGWLRQVERRHVRRCHTVRRHRFGRVPGPDSPGLLATRDARAATMNAENGDPHAFTHRETR